MSILNPAACLFLVYGLFVLPVLAGFATCKPGWEWANNTLHQNPCEIAGALDTECEGRNEYVLGPLPRGSNYVTPQTSDALGRKCNCNTVMFSLYMACTACQNVTTQSWKFWSQYCGEVYVAQYPGSVPANTAIPRWAFVNYTTGNKFDPVAAKAAGRLPEVTAPVPSTVSQPTNPPSSVSMVPTYQGGDSKASPSAGVIAGLTIGILAALIAIGVAAWIFFRKWAATRGDQGHPDDSEVPTSAPMSEHGTLPLQLRPYDPSDPSTYPTYVDYGPTESPHTTSFYTGQYTGAAEL